MTDTTFYKKRLVPTESGLEVFTEKWISLHETECFHFCISERNRGFLYAKSDETPVQIARRKKILKRVSKTCSRFAFDSEEKALEHLKFLKRKQAKHMKRDVLFIDKFLSSDLVRDGRGEVVPDSQDLVNEHYVFD